MTRLALIALLVLLCSLNPSDGVEIIFKNDSDEDFKALHVLVDGKNYKFQKLKSGQSTKPIRVKETYWFCKSIAITAKDTVIFTGFCSVGETIIKDGQLKVSYTIHPKQSDQRRLVANEVLYSGSAKNVGFPKQKWED